MKTKTFDMFIDVNLQCNRYIGLLPMNVHSYTFLSSLILTHVFILEQDLLDIRINFLEVGLARHCKTLAH